MRKLRVFESLSVDGFFAARDGAMDWASAVPQSADYRDWVGKNASGGGELLLGRKTYEMMRAFWPTPAAAAQMPEVAAGMTAATKHVATHTSVPGEWANTRPLAGELVAAVRA